MNPCYHCSRESDELSECVDCDEGVCFDCTKHASGPHECIDYTICLTCHEDRETNRMVENFHNWKTRKTRSDKAKARYHSPAAAAARAAKKVDAARARREREIEHRKALQIELASTMAEFARFF